MKENKYEELLKIGDRQHAAQKRITRIIYADKEFRHQYFEKFGIDLLGRQGT